jgi:hypothetical protein
MAKKDTFPKHIAPLGVFLDRWGIDILNNVVSIYKDYFFVPTVQYQTQ